MRVVIRLVVLLGIFLLQTGSAIGRDSPPPQDYGRVAIDNFSSRAGLAPAMFDHWLHRALYTCKVCHVDIGFAMEAGGTNIRAADNISGQYCGVCHNGKMVFGSKKIFAACAAKPAPGDSERCKKCHAREKERKKEYDFARFTEKFPKNGFGNRIDWEKAEEDGYIKPVEFLQTISVKRQPLPAQKDFSLESKSTWMPDIKFSHKKHVLWMGCETCHPEIFSVKRGSTKFSMLEISSGKYCGACHDKVAFPLNDCQRCHVDPVGP